jgi:cytochrome c oxidase assembly factor CtaG/cytochrome c2
MRLAWSLRVSRIVGFAVVAAPTKLYAHSGQPLAPHDLWSAWTFEPFVILSLLLAALFYGVGVRNLWTASTTGAGLRRREVASFAAGWVTLAIALVSPLHALGGALFSAHMAQHELLISIAAPLLVLGKPLVAFVWAIRPETRRAVGKVSKEPRVSAVWSAVARPGVAFALHVVALWAWHLPGPYQATSFSTSLHALQHTSFVVTALLFWWTVLMARGGEVNRGAAVFYLFATALSTGALGALLAFANGLWYPAYAATTGAWGLSPLEDQQLGGLIMWIPGSLPYLIAGLYIFARWLTESETRVLRREKALTVVRAAAVVAATLVINACDRASGDQRVMLSNADPDRGQLAVKKYGCGSCHTIPGINGARGMVGPPLGQIASRVYIGGVLPNEPDNMIRWIENPPGVDPKTAMPNMGVTTRDARDIAAYLYTLR